MPTMTVSPLCSTLILDFGDVLFNWSPVTTTSITAQELKAILRSSPWRAYECGRLEESECYARIGEQFSLDPAEVHRALLDARRSLKPDDRFLAFFRELKEQSGERIRIYAMSNIPAPDYEFLLTTGADWSLFERVFTSSAAGMRKPNRSFYRYILAETGADPSTAVFLDDKAENVLAARAVGLNAMVFDDMMRVRRALRNYVGDPIARGRAYLAQNAHKLESVSETGVVVEDNFCQLLILEATQDRSLVRFTQPPTKWNFFRDCPVLTTDVFPCDLDTTSIGLMVTHPSPDVFTNVLDEMLHYRDEEDVVLTYFDQSRPRVDPVVCVNVISLFYSQGRGSELARTLDFVHDVLLHRAYIDGTRYYETAEAFLFFTARLLQSTSDVMLHERLKPLLIERLQERVGMAGDALALAMRVLACASVGIRDTGDARALRMMQEEDGGWPLASFYKFVVTNVKTGNRGLTTALAINALIAAEGQSPQLCSTPPASPVESSLLGECSSPTSPQAVSSSSPASSPAPSPSPPASPTAPLTPPPSEASPASPAHGPHYKRRSAHRRLSSVGEIAKAVLRTMLAREPARIPKLKPGEERPGNIAVYATP